MSQTPPTNPTGSDYPIHRAPPPRRRPAWRTWLWIVLALLAMLAVAWLLTPHGQTHPAGGAGGRGGRGGGRIPTVVGVVTAVKGDIPITLTELGTVTSEATITVNTQIAGTLMKVDFKEGQAVKKGQLLAEVDTRPYVVALAQAEGQLAHDQAALADAQLDLRRYQTLASQDSISGQQVDTQAATVKQDEGTVKTDQANIASAKLNLTYCHIIAPVSGRVGLRQVDAGNYITSGLTTGVVVITQFDPIDVVFSIPEDNVPQITARTSQGAVLTATALDRTGATTLAQGQLMTLDNQIDTSTGTIKAKAKFNNPKGMLFPNQFVNITLLVDTLRNVVVVPTAAVRHGSNGDFAFVVDQDPLTGGNIAKMVPIKVGPSQGDKSSIASGLNAGDQVITDGGDRLTDGGTILLPGQIPANFGRPQPKTGFFAWLSGLFGHKPAAGADMAASGAGGGAGTAGAGGGAGGHGGGAARMQAMLDQLNLTPDQKTKIAAIQADQTKAMAAAGDDPDARRTAARDGFTKINAVLTDNQKAKLAQLRAAARAAYGGGAGGASGSPGAAPAATAPAAADAQPSPVAPSPDINAPAPPPTQSAPRAGGAGAGAPGGGRGGGLFAILDDDQKAKAKAIMDQARASGDFSQVRAKIDALLRPDQKAKLEQMRAAHAAAGGGGGGDQ